MTVLMLLVASFLMVINKPMAHVLFSKDFYQAWQCVPILLMASVMHAYTEFYGSIYTSSYKTNFLVISTGIGSVINIILNFILIPTYHGIGAAIATLIGYAVIWLSRVIHSRKIMKIDYHLFRDVISYVLATCQCIVACNSFKYEYVISGSLFLAILIVMRGEIKGILRMLTKRFIK